MRGRLRLVHLLLGALGVACPTYGAIFVVDSTGDGAAVAPTNDGICDAQPGPSVVCTLRAAIQEANALAGTDTIQFAIGAGLVTIQPGSALPTISSVVVIDGTTQPGYAGTPIVEIDGSLTGAGVHGLNLGAGSSTSTIRGLVIDRFSGIGIRVFSSNTIIAGNYIGVDPTGTLAGRGNNVGIYLQGGNGNRIGGTVAGDPNVISGNTVDGIQIDSADATLVQGNIIGLNALGTAAIGNGSQGIAIFNAALNNVIGGAVAARNVISGNGGIGVTMSVAGTTGNRIETNFIGTNAAGTAGIGNFRGVDIGANASGNFVGGAGVGNRIAYNANSGVTLVFNAGAGNLIRENEIFLNGTGLGIDLSDNGVTLNDPGDGDTGPNNLQNFPVLSAAVTNGAGSANFAGSLNSAASTLYRIELFASAAADPSGYGEGQRFLGATNVTTNPSGNAIIGLTLPVALAAGELVTATATDPSNNTSEFSAAIAAVGSLVVTTTANTVDGTTTSISNLIAAPGPDGRISLHEAILATNATAGTDTIRFGIPLSDAGRRYYQNDSIPNSLSVVASTALPDANVTDFDPDYPNAPFSWYRIAPTVALPAITGSVVIDGYTQPGASPNSIAVGNNAVLRIELDGSLVAGANGLMINAINSTVRGLVINFFTNHGLRIGATGATILGNFVGTDVTGTLPRGNNRDGAGTEAGIVLFAGGATIGGTAPSARNLVSSNASGCARGIELWESSGNTIQGNYVGTNAAGTAAMGNGCSGIALDGTPGVGSDNNTIGGAAPGAGNLLSGGGTQGLRVLLGSDNNTIQGNVIGLNAAGTAPLPNAAGGIGIDSAGNLVGGDGPGEGNVIAGNTLEGIGIQGAAATGNAILGNRIFGNGALGIDLLSNGVTPNDPGDGDTGPNDLLNFPFVTAALVSGGVLTAYFKFDVPAGSYRVEFFKNPSGADPSGNGEGENFASSVNINHPGGGSQNFNHAFAGAVGDVITATATFCTDGAACTTFGSTSEFSGAVTAVTTAVKLVSFEAQALDAAVELTWRTGSELDNLGFHLYRSLSESGPYARITSAILPGLGTSPLGTSYRHIDTGLTSGVRYFYKLEDVETTGRTELHGPVSAVPENGDEEEDHRSAYGNPSDVTFRVLERGAGGALVELVTGGFFATPGADGSVRLYVPGFEESGAQGSPALPVKKTWLEIVPGRGVSIASVDAFEVTTLPGLRPANASAPSVEASPGGTVRAGRRRSRTERPSADIVPAHQARIVETGFQGDVKKALLELAPLRWDGATGQLVWTRRLRLRLLFDRDSSSERASSDARGRRRREAETHRSRTVLARLSTSEAGLYHVRIRDVVDSRRQATPETLRLSRRGEAVPFHVESSHLYFVGERDSVYELESAPDGRRMPVLDASPSGPPQSSSVRRAEWEENRYYQASLLDAESLWFWDFLMSPGAKSYPFTVSALLPEDARLEVFLQGASDFDATPDHRVRVAVNGIAVGELAWNGKTAAKLETSLAPGVLRESQNEISIHNTGDTDAAYSMVFLDRIALTYVRDTVAENGAFEGRFTESGFVAPRGLSPGSLVVQTAPEAAWLGRMSGESFRVESGRNYLAVSPSTALAPTVRRATPSGLKDPRRRADYVLIGPRELLPAAEPLLQHRRGQGLGARAVAVEDIYDEFGFGEATSEAVRAFLEYAYHHWVGGAPRYVVLFGDATYDPKDYLKTGVRDRVPALLMKTSYLWTASDPAYAAVNGEDLLPDLALGRLPAATLEEARVLVQKVIEYEESGQSLSGRAVFVADDPDAAGDFEADSDAIVDALPGRDVEKIYLRALGTEATRRAIVESFDRGASLLSYVGHGGIALWASENVLEGKDVSNLSPQPIQPVVMTMNCLNGYFHFPYFDALGEALVKAREKGAIAAFSPSGLSLDFPAHVYHQALVAELTSGRHQRLGDAVLAAQATYAESGLFPELLSIYNLLGDPALRIR